MRLKTRRRKVPQVPILQSLFRHIRYMQRLFPTIILLFLGIPSVLLAQAGNHTPPGITPEAAPAPIRSAGTKAVMEAIAKNDQAGAFQAASEGRIKGDSACTYLLGQMHELGRGAPAVDLKQAFALYGEAAQAGVPEALSAMARCLEFGIGTAVDHPKSMFYWQSAAEANDPPALGRMGQAELEGQLRPANEAAALPWLEKAAAAKDPLGLWLLSRCYDRGLAGLTPSVEKAANLCSQAAYNGQVDAIQRMGELYAIGRGLPGDPVAATGWYRLAADHGHVPALASLALCYLNGMGCRQNDRVAFEFAAAAAKAGHPRGQYLLGRIFDEGLGVRPDPVTGLAYHLRAMKNGVSEARTATERLKAKLKPDEIRKAEELAAQTDFNISSPTGPSNK